jgi:N-acetylneuraminate synthase/sialic acid synthase
MGDIYTRGLLNSAYDHEQSYGATYGAHRAALEFTPSQLRDTRAYARERGLIWFSTAFDERAADRLMALGVPVLKVASGDLTNTPLLTYLASLGVPIILSTGGGSLEDIDRAVRALGSTPHALLHCTAAYPLEPKDAHLAVIPALRARYPETVIGWSSHSPGIALSLVAHGLGATILEHHITLNRAAKGTDHGFSLEPRGLQTLVEDLHKVRCALGQAEKQHWPSEDKPLLKMAKSLVAARHLPAGTVLRPGDLARKSPAVGLPPYLHDSLMGFVLADPLAEDEPITEKHLRSETIA